MAADPVYASGFGLYTKSAGPWTITIENDIEVHDIWAITTTPNGTASWSLTVDGALIGLGANLAASKTFGGSLTDGKIELFSGVNSCGTYFPKFLKAGSVIALVGDSNLQGFYISGVEYAA